MTLSDQIKNQLINELELSEEEATIFLSLIKFEKTSSTNFKRLVGDKSEQWKKICKGLEQKGMIIEISKDVFQNLHPRFAVVNRYRRLCEEKNVIFKKNIKIDNIGILLEGYQNNHD